jgi:cytochrome bd-type quinol oxidase subunit 2
VDPVLPISMPLVLVCTAYVYRIFNGKVMLDADSS